MVPPVLGSKVKTYHVRKIILKNKKYPEQRNKVTVLACLIFLSQGTGPAGGGSAAGGSPLLSLLPLSPLPRRALLRFFLHQMRP